MTKNFNVPEEWFSGTQVGTLIESFRKDVSVIAEGVSELSVRVEQLEKDVTELKSEFFTMKNESRTLKLNLAFN